MRTTLYSLLESLTSAIRLTEPILEFGSARALEQRHLPPVRASFPGQAFFGTDMRLQPGVDQVQDLHGLGLATASVGTALLLDTIEHVSRPWLALEEVYRCLKPGGIVLVTSVFYFPVHDFPNDYWRFTAPAMDVILEPFDHVATGTSGHPLLPHTAVGLAAKAPFDLGQWEHARAAVDSWLAEGATSWKERALLVVPPRLMLASYGWFRGLSTLRNRARTTHP